MGAAVRIPILKVRVQVWHASACHGHLIRGEVVYAGVVVLTVCRRCFDKLDENDGGARNSSDQVESTFDSHLRPPTRRAYLVSAQSSVTNDQEKSDNWSSGDE